MVGASYGFSHARFIKSESFGDLISLARNPERRRVANAPSHLASLKGAVPIMARALLASTRLSIEGPRYDRYETVGEDPQGRTSPVVLWDIVFSGTEPRFGIRYAVGMYNAFDWRYSLPLSPEFTQRAIAQDGRTFLASADVAF
jgi:hypothetical protein